MCSARTLALEASNTASKGLLAEEYTVPGIAVE
jgi:hypothetical protein